MREPLTWAETVHLLFNKVVKEGLSKEVILVLGSKWQGGTTYTKEIFQSEGKAASFLTGDKELNFLSFNSFINWWW